jgi:putative transposase
MSNGQWAQVAQAMASATRRGPKVRNDRTFFKAILYDADAVLAQVEASGRAAIIPSRSHRKAFRAIDKAVYRYRSVIERWFGRLKGFRRVATRYDKTLLSYEGVVAIAVFAVGLSGWRA